MWCGVGMASVIGFAAGVTAGVKMNPVLADRYLLSLGDLGTWVGAAVTAATAGVALWISRKAEVAAKQSELETLELKHLVRPGLIMFEIVSHGRLPAYVHQVFVEHCDFPGKKVDLGFYFRAGNGPVRQKLEHREMLQIPILTNDSLFAAEVYKAFDWQVFEGLSLRIRTSVQEHSGDSFRLDSQVVDEISQAYKFKRPELDGKSLEDLGQS